MTDEYKVFEIVYEHEFITYEEIRNENLGYKVVDNSHPWLVSGFHHGGLTDDGRVILRIKYQLDVDVYNLFFQNEIMCMVMRTNKLPCDELIMVFETPEQAVLATLLCDK